jgi:hypothetical protein
MKWVIFLLSVSLAINSFGQVLRKPLATTYTSSGAYSNHHADAFSFAANAAALAQLENSMAGIYTERRFMLAALSHYNTAIAITTASGNVGLKADYFGYSEYNESQLGLAYARKLGKKVNAGVEFNYNGISMAGYGNASAISFSIGSIFHLSDVLQAGIQLYNPVGGKFGKEQPEKLPALYTIGLGYEPSDLVFISVEIIKEEAQPVNAKAGVQYQFIPQLLARIGVETATTSLWAGIGLLWKSYRLDIATSYHPQLGISPGLLLLYNFKKKEN